MDNDKIIHVICHNQLSSRRRSTSFSIYLLGPLTRLNGLIWLLLFVWYLILLVLLGQNLHYKRIGRHHSQSHKILELILNTCELSKSMESEPAIWKSHRSPPICWRSSLQRLTNVEHTIKVYEPRVFMGFRS